MNQKVYKIESFWDSEARVWVAESDDVPGLATEADTIEALTAKLRKMIPELLLL
jgi:predicted RNase H-like HicB family nuclease